MQTKTIFLSGLLAVFATFSIGANAADKAIDTPLEMKAAPVKAEKPAEAKMKVKRHSHMEEKTGIPQKTLVAMPEKNNAANDKTKHFHPRDGK